MKPLKVHPAANVLPDMSAEEYGVLKDDIEENGLLASIWLSKDGRIIDGRHRYRACEELGIEPEFQETEYEDHEIPDVVIALNLKRRHLSESQRAMVAARIKPFYERAAKERQGARTDLGANVPPSPGKSRDKAAAAVNVSGRSVSYAERVIDDGVEELVGAVDDGTLAVSDASKAAKEPKAKQKKLVKMVRSGKAKNVKDALKQVRTAEQIAKIEKTPPAKGTYHVIVIDPPWQFQKTRMGDPTQRGTTPYPTMSEEEISALDVPAAEDCILWCWTTNAHVPEACRIIERWGFEHKTILTWVKPHIGIGDWLRGQTEHCILAVKGKPKMKGLTPSTVLEAPVGEHSRKPDEFYELVERCCPGNRLDMFGRVERKDWTAWGAEAGMVA